MVAVVLEPRPGAGMGLLVARERGVREDGVKVLSKARRGRWSARASRGRRCSVVAGLIDVKHASTRYLSAVCLRRYGICGALQIEQRYQHSRCTRTNFLTKLSAQQGQCRGAWQVSKRRR